MIERTRFNPQPDILSSQIERFLEGVLYRDPLEVDSGFPDKLEADTNLIFKPDEPGVFVQPHWLVCLIEKTVNILFPH